MAKRVELGGLTGTQNLMLGMAAGCCSKIVNYPLLSWKNASQQSLPFSLNPTIVYRGLPMAVINLGGTTAVQFLLAGGFQRWLVDLGASRLAVEMGGSFLGGALSGIPCSLWELTMIQQQRFGGTLLNTPVRLSRSYGAATLLRGTTVTMGRESLYTMAMLGVTPVIQRTLVEKYSMDESLALAGGALLGSLFSATVTHPLDTIKTCMQGDVERKKYKGIRATGRLLAQEHGVAKGLFKGLTWRVALITTTFFLVNKFKQTLAPIVFPSPPISQKWDNK